MGGPQTGYNLDLVFEKDGSRKGKYQKSKVFKDQRNENMYKHMMRQSQNYQDNWTDKFGSQSKWSGGYAGDPISNVLSTAKKVNDSYTKERRIGDE